MNKQLLIPFCLFLLLMTPANSIAGLSMLPPVTQVQASQCGQVLPALNASIYANNVSGASNYRWRVTCTHPGGTVETQVYTSVLRVFNLTNLANYYFSRTYSIEVAVNVGGWQPYGPACTVISPTPVTTIQSSQCGVTMTSMNDPIYADLVPAAPGYRFRIVNVNNPAQFYSVDKTVRDLRLTNFPVYSGATYNIDVAVKNYDGTYLPYGAVCSITAPILFTKVNAYHCGRVINSFSETIYADDAPGATGYRFKFTNMANASDVQYLDRPLRTFTFSMLPNVQYNAAYRIEVAIKDAQGNWLSYGPFCTVFTPVLPFPKIQLSQCEMTCTNTSEMMYADDFANATVYRFRLENPNIGYSYYIDRPTRCYNLSMFPGLQPNTAYTVKVAVKVNNVFTGFGKACDVTTPATFPASRVTKLEPADVSNDKFLPIPYPNPFSDYFSIDVSLQADAEVSVKVYDMTGRLLENRTVRQQELGNIQFGKEYPSGVYNAVLRYDDQTRTARLVKR